MDRSPATHQQRSARRSSGTRGRPSARTTQSPCVVTTPGCCRPALVDGSGLRRCSRGLGRTRALLEPWCPTCCSRTVWLPPSTLPGEQQSVGRTSRCRISEGFPRSDCRRSGRHRGCLVPAGHSRSARGTHRVVVPADGLFDLEYATDDDAASPSNLPQHVTWDRPGLDHVEGVSGITERPVSRASRINSVSRSMASRTSRNTFSTSIRARTSVFIEAMDDRTNSGTMARP